LKEHPGLRKDKSGTLYKGWYEGRFTKFEKFRKSLGKKSDLQNLADLVNLSGLRNERTSKSEER